MIWPALLLIQAFVLAGPREAPAPATAWQCRYTGSDGAKFELSGRFAEFPVGSLPNVYAPTRIAGNGPAVLLGEKPVQSVRTRGGGRNYQVGFNEPSGDRYNLNFAFAKRGETPADITHWSAKQERLTTIAKGKCVADFSPDTQSAP